MAWISVHEDIMGGKLRELSKSLKCSQNESIGILVRLWLWCINNADKDGRIIGASQEDISEILNIGRSKELDPDKIVKSLIECDWLESIDGMLFVHDWEEWQEPLYTFKERRERDRMRKKRERAAEKSGNTQGEQPEGKEEPAKESEKEVPKHEVSEQVAPIPDEPDMKTENKPARKRKLAYSENFEEFWNVYPRKEGKGEAYKKYKARLNDGYSEKELIEAARNYANVCSKECREMKYIKHAKTFLSDSTPFIDFLPKNRESALYSVPQPAMSEDGLPSS